MLIDMSKDTFLLSFLNTYVYVTSLEADYQLCISTDIFLLRPAFFYPLSPHPSASPIPIYPVTLKGLLECLFYWVLYCNWLLYKKQF